MLLNPPRFTLFMPVTCWQWARFGVSAQLAPPRVSPITIASHTCPAAAVAPASVPEFLPALAELARMHHFAHAANLHETVWKQLPAIANNMGKKVTLGQSGRSSLEWRRCGQAPGTALTKPPRHTAILSPLPAGLQAFPGGLPGPPLPQPYLRPPPVRGRGGTMHWFAA